MAKWRAVYDLSEDVETIRLTQKATLTTDDFGLVPDVALFGTKEWWEAIQDKRIPRMVVEGRIKRLLLSGHNDWAEFDVEDASGAVSRWTRVGDLGAYREGTRVRIEYVMQKTKAGSFGPSREQPNVLRILVKECDYDRRGA